VAANKRRQSGDFRLAVDVGNTHTVLGLFRGREILRSWRVATRKDTTVDEIAFWLQGLADQDTQSVSKAALASVVPTQDEPWLAALEEVFRIRPQILDWRNCLGLRLDYEIPRQIGADRLANVLGAQALGISEGVVIDFGTATTFDVFVKDAYLGGVICPGIQSGMRSLAQNTAKLAEAELKWPKMAVGRNSDDAMRIGVLKGTAGMVEYLLRNILKETGLDRKKSWVLATGGLAFWMRDRVSAIQRFEPDLTLMGINHLLSSKVVIGKKRRRVK